MIASLAELASMNARQRLSQKEQYIQLIPRSVLTAAHAPMSALLKQFTRENKLQSFLFEINKAPQSRCLIYFISLQTPYERSARAVLILLNASIILASLVA